MAVHFTGPILFAGKDSPRKWFENLPVDKNPDFVTYMDDFTGITLDTTNDWTLLKDSSATAALGADAESGTLVLTSQATTDNDGRLILARNCDITTKTAPKWMGVAETINLVKERLAFDAEGKPHLYIHDNCKELLKEFRQYQWADRVGKDVPIKKHDHGMDALRYEISFLYRWMRHQ